MRNGNGIMGRTNPNRYTDLGDNLIHFNEVGITCSAKEVERIIKLGTMLIAIDNHFLSHIFPK
jgi:hypothetical protein